MHRPADPLDAPVQDLSLSPTDVSQFIRLEQCERYLRLRLTDRAAVTRFMREYGVEPQPLPPLLTRSGRAFEEQVKQAAGARFPVIDLAEETGGSDSRPPDNDRVLAEARELREGGVMALFQPRLAAELDGWRLTGDADLLRLERGGDGGLRVLIVDVKSSASVKVEHRLQVAFYHAMLARLFEQERIEGAEIGTGILYRRSPDDHAANDEEAARLEAERVAAREWLGIDAQLEIVADPRAYLDSVRDLVTGPDALARRLAAVPFEMIPFHLTGKCDGCLYNELCLKWSAERDDLSLIPHLTSGEKGALQRAGIETVSELVGLKEPVPSPDGERAGTELTPAPGKEALCRRVATTWPVGHRVDELIHRARRYRKWKGEDLQSLDYIPSKGYGSLPYCDAHQNPNLIRIFIDAQHDYLQDRIYMLGALVVACEAGKPARRRSVVHLTEGPPDSAAAERRLFQRWIRDLLRAVVETAAPDAEGNSRAPIHLVLFNGLEQQILLTGLSRHLTSVLGAAPALYDFMTQLAAFDSPIVTFLDQEIRELKNYPMLCQSLQAVAGRLRFDWDQPEPFTKLFRARLFDHWKRLERDGEEPQWYTGRARFGSQIPLEYAYAAWGELEPSPDGRQDDLAPFRAATPDRLQRFQARRLEAMEQIAADFPGNRLTEKTPFNLPDLADFTDTAPTLAHALDEFVMIERHVDLHAWKMIRHAPPERRVLVGETLIARYREEDQAPGVAAINRENQRRFRLREQYEAAFRAENPETAKVALSKEQRAETALNIDGLRVRLRLETDGLECDLEEALALMTLQEGDRFVLNPRWTTDSRLPEAERTPFMPTPKQMLYALRAAFLCLEVERDAAGRAVGGWVEVELQQARGGKHSRGFAFDTFPPRTLMHGELYTLDPCPNDWSGYFSAMVTKGLCDAIDAQPAGLNALYDRIQSPAAAQVEWPAAAVEAQARFQEGLDRLHEIGPLHGFEESKRQYIGRHGEAPILLVQGPPGTGKSYSTAFALFARMQGALAAGRPFRAVLSCKTHAAIDVLLENVVQVRDRLREFHRDHPELFERYFDARLLEAPLYRVAPREAAAEGVIPVPKDREKEKGEPKSADRLAGESCCVAAATPGAIYQMVKARWDRELFGHGFCDCLVLDEASQMNLPEAIMAALPLREDGQLIVVGDHRQMPPIVKHDWDREPRRTFQEYQAYQSLFLTLLPLKPPTIRFAESFRLHRDMAEFLRQEIYHQDGIEFHSRKHDVLPRQELEDAFVAAVLSSEHPLVVIVHGEAGSQTRNPFEQALIAPVLAALADPEKHGLDADDGLGVVVPHRAQRAAVQNGLPFLRVVDEATGSVRRSAVDTVERFQGGERTVILVSATESDREFVLASSRFLLDPRRLTVAMSRAKQKLVLVASRSVFTLFSPDEETFLNSQLWKNLLRRTCTVPLWQGEREGVGVEVWGNQ
jgi:hypothetical protein